MPCDTRLKPKQTLKQRATEVRNIIQDVEAKLSTGAAKPIIDKRTGAIAFTGIDSIRDGVTDACVYRRILATGSATARAAIARAEALAGRTVSKQTVAAGLHSHDGGATWHSKG